MVSSFLYDKEFIMYVLIIIGIAIFLTGIFVGIVLSTKYMQDRDFGTIKWAWSEDGPYLFLDMDRPPEDMPQYKYVVFRTDLRDGSQK